MQALTKYRKGQEESLITHGMTLGWHTERAAYLSSGCVLCDEAKEGNHGQAAVLDLIVLNDVARVSQCRQTEHFIF